MIILLYSYYNIFYIWVNLWLESWHEWRDIWMSGVQNYTYACRTQPQPPMKGHQSINQVSETLRWFCHKVITRLEVTKHTTVTSYRCLFFKLTLQDMETYNLTFQRTVPLEDTLSDIGVSDILCSNHSFSFFSLGHYFSLSFFYFFFNIFVRT